MKFYRKMSPLHRRQTIAVSVFLGFVVFLMCSFRVAIVRGDSMNPTYTSGQYVLVNKLKSSAKLTKGDVIVLRKGNDVLIKRVAYLPGEIISGSEIISFVPAKDYFELPPPSQDGKVDRFKLMVPEKMVVVLGDNPEVSDDSRLFGPIPTTDIIGVVINAAPKEAPRRETAGL